MPIEINNRILERGFAKALRFLREVPEAMERVLRQDVESIATAVLEEAKRFVPVDTVALKKSIRIKRLDRLRLVVRAGDAIAPYAGWVEFGTSISPAQPFMRPAIANVMGRKAPKDFAQHLGEAIARVAIRTTNKQLRPSDVVISSLVEREFARILRLGPARGSAGRALRQAARRPIGGS